MKRTSFLRLIGALIVALTPLLAAPVHAQDEAADAMIKRLSTEVLDSIKADPSLRSGDVLRLNSLVDAKLMPSTNFRRMTASAAGPSWRQMTPEQQKRLQEEFKLLLVRSYAGAMSQASELSIVVKPLRASAEDR